jgi:hypothetical protein
LPLVTTLAGVIALVALGAVIVSLGYLHVAPTGLSPVRNAVSQYGITPFRAGYRVATIAFAVAALGLALGLHRALRASGNVRFVIGLLTIFAITRALISWFPMDAPGTPRTTTGRQHGLLAIAAFIAATIAAFRLGSALSGGARWHSLAPVSTALGGAMLACLLAIVVARRVPAVHERFGAIERGFYLAAIAWFAVFSLACALGA